MDGENNGKPYEQMDDLGEKNPIFGSTPISVWITSQVAVSEISPQMDLKKWSNPTILNP